MSALNEDFLVQRLMSHSPFRTDFQRHYETIVADYNREKNRATLEQTFEALVKFVRALDETGLPLDSYSEEEVRTLKTDVFRDVLRVYPYLPSPIYGSAA